MKEDGNALRKSSESESSYATPPNSLSNQCLETDGGVGEVVGQIGGLLAREIQNELSKG